MCPLPRPHCCPSLPRPPAGSTWTLGTDWDLQGGGGGTITPSHHHTITPSHHHTITHRMKFQTQLTQQREAHTITCTHTQMRPFQPNLAPIYQLHTYSYVWLELTFPDASGLAGQVQFVSALDPGVIVPEVLFDALGLLELAARALIFLLVVHSNKHTERELCHVHATCMHMYMHVHACMCMQVWCVCVSVCVCRVLYTW